MSNKTMHILKMQNRIPFDFISNGEEDSPETLVRKAAWNSRKSWRTNNPRKEKGN